MVKRLHAFPHMTENKAKITNLTTSVQHHIGSPSPYNKKGKEIKCKIPKESVRNPLELISMFSRVTEYHVSVQNSIRISIY